MHEEVKNSVGWVEIDYTGPMDPQPIGLEVFDTTTISGEPQSGLIWLSIEDAEEVRDRLNDAIDLAANGGRIR